MTLLTDLRKMLTDYGLMLEVCIDPTVVHICPLYPFQTGFCIWLRIYFHELLLHPTYIKQFELQCVTGDKVINTSSTVMTKVFWANWVSSKWAHHGIIQVSSLWVWCQLTPSLAIKEEKRKQEKQIEEKLLLAGVSNTIGIAVNGISRLQKAHRNWFWKSELNDLHFLYTFQVTV